METVLSDKSSFEKQLDQGVFSPDPDLQMVGVDDMGLYRPPRPHVEL